MQTLAPGCHVIPFEVTLPLDAATTCHMAISHGARNGVEHLTEEEKRVYFGGVYVSGGHASVSYSARGQCTPGTCYFSISLCTILHYSVLRSATKDQGRLRRDFLGSCVCARIHFSSYSLKGDLACTKGAIWGTRRGADRLCRDVRTKSATSN
jgi:hypothetical protein